MKRRKLIGIIMAYPESIYQQRVLDGIFDQCEKYGYDTAVFSTLVPSCHLNREYLHAELNIFNLINFDRLDGVIVVTNSLMENQTTWIREKVCKMLDEKCRTPVVSLDSPLGDYHVVYTSDSKAFSAITAHVLDVHNCKNIYFLAGPEGHSLSKQRLAGFTDELKNRRIAVDKNNIFYGDFWYTGGKNLAKKIANKEVPMPEAVICASDHMAIGLTKKLITYGIKVPEQIIVTGYDATPDAAINFPSITSYIPDVRHSSIEAVNYLRSVIEPNAEIISCEGDYKDGLRLCASCGCPEDHDYIKSCLNNSFYKVNHDYDEHAFDTVDISQLLDSYIFENYTQSANAEDCLWNIFGSCYLLRPYNHYYLCLKENWLDTDDRTVDGYPPRMNNIIHTVSSSTKSVQNGQHMTMDSSHVFNTELMLPQLYEERSEPCVFYFSPMHFSDNTLGYSVLQRKLTEQQKIGCVFRNWIRNVNNSLEMIRVQSKLVAFSERDAMTGLYNRRGMYAKLGKMIRNAKSTDSIVVFVIDMDSLKYINDTYGHTNGDYGINAVASAARRFCKNTEICVRAGGDEFYIIGVGDYSDEDVKSKAEKFNFAVEDENKASDKPYRISASIGYCRVPISSDTDIEAVIQRADDNMYKSKCARKMQRK